jgi:methanogenic corrinoid protein MtbC1
MNGPFTPKKVAVAIGVSESSLKRWCDKGLIDFSKTAGGHRRISLPSVVQFLRTSKHEVIQPHVLGLPPANGARTKPIENAQADLKQLLLSGDEKAARAAILDYFLAGNDIACIGDRLVAPVFHDFGRLWENGEVEIFQERRACEITVRVIHEMRTMIPPPQPDAPVAIGGTIQSDPYVLPTNLVDTVLASNGWNSTSLGTMLPFDTLLSAAIQYRPRIFWVSVSKAPEATSFVDEFNKFQQDLPSETALVVGGRALTESIRSQIRYTAFCDNLSHLESYAESIVPPKSIVPLKSIVPPNRELSKN